jgi:heme exporter protein D
MADFLGMGHYGIYVWPAYIVFFIVLVFDAISPTIQRKRALKELQARLKREAAKKSA